MARVVRSARAACVASAFGVLVGCARPAPARPPPPCEEIAVPQSSAEPVSAPKSETATVVERASEGFQYGVPDEDRSAVEERDLGRPERFRVRRIGALADEATRSRPGGARRVDVDLVKAPFDEAVRLLADTGRFNVVVEAPGASPVTVRLKGVDPFDVLVVIAEARGLEVRFERGIVVVGALRKDSTQ
ncbi:MAG: hypothetical protein U0271_30895 [Polyangiaceae bacterium]